MDDRRLPCHECGHDYRLHRTGLNETLGSCNVPDCICYDYERDPTHADVRSEGE